MPRLSAAGDRGLPAPRELSAVILARVAALPAAAQSFLAAASVLGQHAPVSAIVSVARLPDARNEVDAAVAAGLLTEDASALELAFAHPLYRAAIYADLSPASRRKLHARAGEVVAGRARLAHRAAASLGPDEALAGELEASARAAAAAGDAAASAWALEQAAALSLAAQDREAPAARRRRGPAQRRGYTCGGPGPGLMPGLRVLAATLWPGFWGCSPDRLARRVACSPRGRPTTRGPRVKPERVPRHPWPTGWSCLVAPTRR